MTSFIGHFQKNLPKNCCHKSDIGQFFKFIGTLYSYIGQCIFPGNIFSDFATTCPFLIGQYSDSLDNNQFYWTLSQKFTAKLLPRIGYWTIFQLYWTFFKIYWNIFAIYWTFFKIYWTILPTHA